MPPSEGLDYDLVEGYVAVCGLGSCTDTDIVIPAVQDGMKVTAIDDGAFQDCAALTNFTLPDGITYIGRDAFAGTAFYNDEANWTDGVLYIGRYLIDCKKDKTGEVVIREGTTFIARGAFKDCVNITSMYLPNSVTTIGESAFSGCSGLMRIMVAEDNPVYHADGNCLIETESKALLTGFDNSVIPTDGSVTRIAPCAFYDCSNLTSITIPDSVTSIGSFAFSGCTGLTSITIPNSVTSIGWSAFEGCSGLTSITFTGTMDQWNAISKDYDRDSSTGSYTIHCTDGDISK